MRSSACVLADDEDPGLSWTLALAGGEGVRLQDYVSRRFGARIPKQYCRMIGDQTMLEHTLDRMNRVVPASRTLTVIGADHAAWAFPQLAGRSDHVFCQPAARDTGVALYVALSMIMRWHPNAIVTITPTDHYVAPLSTYVQTVHAARDIAARHRDLVVVLGVAPTEPDPDLGYLLLGPALAEEPGVRAVTAFVEKPRLDSATELWRAGALWSTMVVSSSATALWELGRAAAPKLLEILDCLIPLIGTEDEDDAIDYIYRAYLPISFSRDICERSTERIYAMPVCGVEWSDLGRPERIERVIAHHDTRVRSRSRP